jgi:hypothetical protein
MYIEQYLGLKLTQGASHYPLLLTCYFKSRVLPILHLTYLRAAQPMDSDFQLNVFLHLTCLTYLRAAQPTDSDFQSNVFLHLTYSLNNCTNDVLIFYNSFSNIEINIRPWIEHGQDKGVLTVANNCTISLFFTTTLTGDTPKRDRWWCYTKSTAVHDDIKFTSLWRQNGHDRLTVLLVISSTSA